MPARIPVFIISFNRGAQLLKAIDSYRRQTVELDFVVHDNGSDDPQTLAILAQIAAGGIRVHRASPIRDAWELERVDATIAAYFGAGHPRRRYIVTDCDVDLSVASPQAIEVYGTLLDEFPGAECVGPMLRIDDIPVDYPLFNRVMNRHIEQFWQHRPLHLTTILGACAVRPAPIDTTFALHREGRAFRRLKQGLRVYAPFDARHLDWYPEHWVPGYRKTSAAAIAHWNNAQQFAEHCDEPLRFQGFQTVEALGDGALRTRWVQLPATDH